jgi:glycosyltransferase involved in cell wall biosynthesis
MSTNKQLRVAIVHDWLVGGGAERVVLELHKLFPGAPIYTSYCTDEWRERLDGKVVTGWLQHFGKLRKFLVLGRIWWFSHLNFDGYDLVISSSGNGEAFGIHVPKGTKHICYCHTPTHYYWRHYEQYVREPGFGPLNWLARMGLRILVGPLRKWDWRAAQRPDYFIANSTHIQADIQKYYGRKATVIFPPVDTNRFTTAATERHGFVAVGRQVPYKHTDVIVRACSQRGLPLTVVGNGPDHDRLVQLAGPSITFDTAANDEAVEKYMRSASAFLFAAYEDFGITPVEALAAGTPVIAFKAGGALDYVVPGKTGEFFEPQTAKALADVLKNFNPQKYDATKIATFAEQFSTPSFSHNMKEFIDKVCADHAK